MHQESGKSHTGCSIVLVDGGPLYNKSTKQKIVTKSSTEAELVGLSDTASQAIHLRNFVMAQGYEVGPAVIYQDNLSCMALMKRGGPDCAFTISVRMALKTRGAEATPVIMAELQQMVDKQVWHGVHLRNLSTTERKRINVFEGQIFSIGDIRSIQG